MSDFLLEPPVETVAPTSAVAPIVGRPATLGGIDWAEVAAEARGEIALVEVEVGAGERQEWGRRGDQA